MILTLGIIKDNNNLSPVVSNLYYRLLLIIFLFSIAPFHIFAQTYLISTYNGQTVNTCTGRFYDSGGSASDYGNNENDTVTFCSNNSNAIQFDFTVLNIRSGDTLFIYDGPNTSSTLIRNVPGL